MIRKALLGVFGLIAALILIVAAKTLFTTSKQLNIPPEKPVTVDSAAASARLAAAVKLPTISSATDAEASADAFKALHQHILTSFPKLHAALKREMVGSYGLLYTWPGTDSLAKPIALLAHQDVVPIAPGTEALWKKPPFAGVIEEGFVWGRGALDDKSNVITQLEAVEALIKSGFKPRRTVYLVFGHDEEVGGRLGAVAIVALLKERGVKLDFVLDEGMVVTEGILPGVAKPIALIGLAEKGSVSLRLSAQAPPGHSSMPPAPGGSAIGMLSAALTRVDQNPLPGGIGGAAAELFATIAPELGFGQRVALSNLWLFRPLIEPTLAKGAATNAMMRTTTALTIVNAGNKENVLPGRAEAVVNFRILPGDTAESVAAHVKRVVADDRIEIKPLGTPAEPSRVSAADADGYRVIERAIREVFPDAMVAPSLVLVGTDSRHFGDIADQVYRFMPIRFKPEDLARPHGTDERIAIDQLADMVRFYHRLLTQAAQ